MKSYYIFAASLIVLLVNSNKVQAEISPSEVLIVVNKNVPESQMLGNEYSKLRNIPKENIFELDTINEFSIPREHYEKNIAFPLKQKIISEPNKNFKVIALTYGLPFKIDEISMHQNQNSLMAQVNLSASQIQNEIKDSILNLQNIEKEFFNENANIFLKLEEINLVNVPKKVFELHSKLKVKDSNKKSSKAIIKIEELALELLGKKLYLTQPLSGKSPHHQEIAELEKKLLLTPDDLKNLDATTVKILVKANSELNGKIGAFNSLKLIMDRILGKETSASIDSELSLIWLFPGGYPISSRLPNPYYIEQLQNDSSVNYPFLMVSRLDGPNPEIVKKNIRTAMNVEKVGFPESNFLIDSRGLGFEVRDEFGKWDRSLTSLAKKSFGENITIEFDSSPEIASNVEDISIYLGWYRLRNYEDSYSFVPGAIGFHIASEEAINLHDPIEKGWCKNLLERGVVATVGAVEEPYLDSFPEPQYFFQLMASGKFALVDAYYLSTKYVSWRQILIGDPLYNPFKNSKNNLECDFKLPSPPSAQIKNYQVR